MTDKFKVFFHAGPDLGLKTHAERGVAWLADGTLSVKDGATDSLLVIPLSDISNVRMFRLHGLGRVIEIDHSGGRLFLSVIRFMIGQFATINFFRTGALYNQLRDGPARRTDPVRWSGG